MKNAKCEKSESKILYNEGSDLRVIRGKIVSEDSYFINISREDGEIRISKGAIVKIELWRRGNNNERLF
jgi:hypothetical protein